MTSDVSRPPRRDIFIRCNIKRPKLEVSVRRDHYSRLLASIDNHRRTMIPNPTVFTIARSRSRMLLTAYLGRLIVSDGRPYAHVTPWSAHNAHADLHGIMPCYVDAVATRSKMDAEDVGLCRRYRP